MVLHISIRTNIDINDDLMQQAMASSEATTKRDVVEEALRLLVQTRSQGRLRRLRGKVAWVDYFNGLENPETNWLEARLDQDRLGLTTIILTEILKGIGDEKTASLVVAELRQFAIFEGMGQSLAIQAAANYRALRKRGKTPRKIIDVLIATFCIEEQHSLLHRDRDFDPFEELLGLNVVHP